MSSAWFRVVKDYYPKNFGLTIPFVLGALRRPVGQVLSDDESREQLRDLLVAMRDDAPHPYHVIIQGCGNLKEPIITLSDIPPGGGLRLDSPTTKGRALYFQPFYGLPVDDFESLVDGLWDRYKTDISKGYFSCSPSNATWRAFDATELANLKNYCGIM